MKKTISAFIVLGILAGYAISTHAALAFGVPDEPDVIIVSQHAQGMTTDITIAE